MTKEKEIEKKEQGRLRHFLGLSEVAGYFFRSKAQNKTSNINLKMMHGINKISMLVFLGGIIFILLKKFVF
jgi:hypothetical protein